MKPSIPVAYRGAVDLPCPTCGAEPGDFCIVDDDRRGPRRRRVPCVRRCPPSAPELEFQPAPAHLTRSFSESVHQLEDEQ